jgi:hypothetical protein
MALRVAKRGSWEDSMRRLNVPLLVIVLVLGSRNASSEYLAWVKVDEVP